MSTQNNDILNVKLTPKKAKEAMALADMIQDSLMIWGSPGIGKSAIARQYADENYPLRKDNVAKVEFMKQQIEADTENADQLRRELAAFEAKLIDQDTNFIDFRLSQIEPSDLRGIPVPEKVFLDMDGNQLMESELASAQDYIAETAVVWAAPKVLKLSPDWKGVILFDEINSAMPIVQAASYQLILDRCVGEMKLPKTALILAAGNRETDGGVTFSLATPLRDRMTHIEMIPYHQDWINDYAIGKRLNPATVAFINNTGAKHFNTLSPQDPSHSGGTSPRSWEAVARYEDLKKVKNIDKEVFRAMIAGRVGEGVATEYIEYVDNVAKLPDTMSILQGEIKEIDASLDISANYFITLNLVYKIIDLYNEKQEQRLPVEDWGKLCNNFITFLDHNFSATQAELAVLAIRTITLHKVAITIKDVPAFKDFVMKYSDLVRKARSLG
jgi:MoxR-like ATPase